jgi:hypothetical protein
VRAVDGRGHPVAGATVEWAVVAGGGSVSPATTQTDASGVASVQWTLGSQGAQTLEARSGTAVRATFTGTILPTYIFFREGPSAVAPGSSAQYVFEVRYGSEPLPGALVEWSLLSAGGATLTPHSARTGPDGRAHATLTVTSLQANHIIRIRAGTVTADVGVSVTGPITMTDVSGSGGRGINPPTGYAQARISSTAGAITGARATLAGREAELSYDASTQLWKGSIDMTGVAGGTYTGTITATDASGNSRVATFTAGHDANPVVVIVEPSTESATARGSIRIRATCSWQLGTGPGDCATLYSRVFTESAVILPSAQGRSEIDVSVPLPAGPATVRITVQWNDRQAVYYMGKDTVEVTVTP